MSGVREAPVLLKVHREVVVGPGRVHVRIIEANITEVCSDVVVNAANSLSFMPMDGGVSGALRNACKPDVVVRKEKTWWDDEGAEHKGLKIPTLQAGVQDAAGGLASQGVRYIVHAVGPNWNDYPISDRTFRMVLPRIRKVVARSLNASNYLIAKSCTIPAISGGIFTHYHPTTNIKQQEQLAARKAVVQAVLNWAATTQDPVLTSIDICDRSARQMGGIHLFLEAFDTAITAHNL